MRRLGVGILLASATLLVLAAALTASLPVSVLSRLAPLPPQVETLSGRALAGRATLAGGLVLDWRAQPGALWSGALPVALELRGPATLLDGTLRVSPGIVALTGIAGRAGPEMLALVPGSGSGACTTRAVVAIERLAWHGWTGWGASGRGSPGRAEAAGGLRMQAGACALPDGGALELPAMRLDLMQDGPDAIARVVPEAGGAALGSLRVGGDRRAVLRLEPEAAPFLPGLSDRAATVLEVGF